MRKVKNYFCLIVLSFVADLVFTDQIKSLTPQIQYRYKLWNRATDGCLLLEEFFFVFMTQKEQDNI